MLENEKVRADATCERYRAQEVNARLHDLLVYRGFVGEIDDVATSLLGCVKLLATELVSVRSELDELRQEYDAYREAVASEMIEHGWAGGA